MIKADWTGGSMRRSMFEKLNVQLCAVALCGAGAVAGPRGLAIALASLILAGSTLPAAAAETVLYSFSSLNGGPNGANPEAGLIFGKDGALYGTTLYGGGTICQEKIVNGHVVEYRCGTVFKLTPPAAGHTTWTLATLYSFGASSNGVYPLSGLVFDKEGALYGTTSNGASRGCGTVFKLTPPAAGHTAWTPSTLVSFGASGNSCFPGTGLIIDTQGALYGTTASGGSVGGGTVFKLTPPAVGQTVWKETVLFSFPGGSGGSFPKAGVIFDTHGALYGTTNLGGSNLSGTVFKLTPPAAGQTAWKETVLANFSNTATPVGSLIFDAHGALYGTTNLGGIHNFGIVYKLAPPAAGQTAWNASVLYSYTGGGDGGHPEAGLLVDAHGALYGTTANGGACSLSGGCGVAFKLTPPAVGQTAWKETVLVDFAGANGISPFAGLIFDTKGALYGTTTLGGGVGGLGAGTVFELPGVQ